MLDPRPDRKPLKRAGRDRKILVIFNLLDGELESRAKRRHLWVGKRRTSWP